VAEVEVLVAEVEVLVAEVEAEAEVEVLVAGEVLRQRWELLSGVRC
jgi:hypothetical protein